MHTPRTEPADALAAAPPMGWNSWDCYGASITEQQFKDCARRLAERLLPFGWQYAVIDIQWFQPDPPQSRYRASDDLLVISTEEDLGKEMLLKVYDVSDLLARVPRFANAPRINLAGTSAGGGEGALSGGTDDDHGQAGQRGQGPETDIDKLVELIVETVEPDSWVAGGGLGTIRAFGSQLVVWNSIRVHQALGGPVEGGG